VPLGSVLAVMAVLPPSHQKIAFSESGDRSHWRWRVSHSEIGLLQIANTYYAAHGPAVKFASQR